jgi:flagellin FlaB
MGKIIYKIKEKDVGAIGIGAMIVFISMVLVAGIAASVLVQTSSRLETQAMQSGSETISEVSTGIHVDNVYGYNASGAGAISRLAIEVRPRAGSTGIDISETIVELSDSNTKNLFTYNSGNFTDTPDINGDVFSASFYPFNSGVTYGIIVLEDADDSITATNPVLNSGDHVILTVNVSNAFGNLGTRVDIAGQVIPEDGSAGVIAFTTPAAYNTDVVELQ